MSRTVTIQTDHGCSRRRGDCQAVRCESGCGQLEHTKPYELPDWCLRHDMAVAYVEGANCGPGLITQIRNALAQPSGILQETEGGTPNKPGSKPPGWNADASELIADIRVRWDTADQPLLVDWRRVARSLLGFSVPSVRLKDVFCFVCKEASLRVAQDASSDVWCANPACHDDDRYVYCGWVDDLGYPFDLGYGSCRVRPDCRRTDRSLVHGVRWPRHSWGPIWEQMQAEKQARELAEVGA